VSVFVYTVAYKAPDENEK